MELILLDSHSTLSPLPFLSFMPDFHIEFLQSQWAGFPHSDRSDSTVKCSAFILLL